MITAIQQEFDYPLAPHTSTPWPRSWGRRLAAEVDGLIHRVDSPRKSLAKLEPIRHRPFRQLTDHDMPLVFLSHNVKRFLHSFLKHYRDMGVSRFLCVDDYSEDGSRELLTEQPDVDLYGSNVRFAESARGKAWREQLFDLYGYDRWYLNVDADEYFVYESLGKESVGDFADRLLQLNVFRIPAVMVDMYPVESLGKARFDGADERMPWQIATHFDGSGYRGKLRRRGLEIKGGVRSRLFHLEAELVKYPLIYWKRNCSLNRSIHFPLPTKYSFAQALGCLLHFKVFDDLAVQIRNTIKNGQHFDSSEHYRDWLNRLDEGGLPSLEYEDSIPYQGAQDMVDRGFLLPIAA
jgi:hypothetical protein